MENRFKIIVILLIILLIVTINNYTRKPQENNEAVVRIAVTYEKLAENVMTIPRPASEEKVIALIKYTEKEINQYCLDNQIEVKFRFIPTPVIHKGGTSSGENPPGLDEMIQLNQSGINLIVGHDYSLANRYSLDYANEHSMLLLSTFGVGVGQSIADDNLFKLTPNFYEDPEVYEKVFAQMIKELGYKAFLTINTGMRRFYPNLINEIATALNYSYRATLVVVDINSDDFDPYLDRAEGYLLDLIEDYGEEDVCVLVEPLWGEDEVFLDVADRYPILSNVTWFDYVGLPEEFVIEEGYADSLAKYGYVRLVISPCLSNYSVDFWEMYLEEVGDLPTPSKKYLEAARYDAMWIMAMSVIEANSSRTNYVKMVFPGVCSDYFGIIGDCTLNSFGDRISADYGVYRWVDNMRFQKIGHFDSSLKKFKFE